MSPVKLSRTPGAPAGPGPALGEHTREVLAKRGYAAQEVDVLESTGAVGGPSAVAPGAMRSDNGLLRMRELAEASGVSAGTIKHYLREGLLPEPASRPRATWPTTRPSSSSGSS